MLRQASSILLVLAAAGCVGPNSDSASATDWEPLIQEANQALFNEGQPDRVGEFFTASYGRGGGREWIREFVSGLRAAFPDLEVEVEVLVANDDRIAWLRRARGTQQGEYMGVPASGRELTWQTMVVSRIEDGLIAEEWSVSGLAGALRSPQ